jgi:guanosine-3',5'-bis(diphosphate) 3'-pyrophosphohydrolase
MPEDVMIMDREQMLTELLDKIRRFHPHDNLAVVEKAFLFSYQAHVGQKRKSGEPYFTHPYETTSILAGLMLDGATVAAGLLHDAMEDCENVTMDVITREFGSDIALMVDGVTKLSRMDFTTKEEQKAESLRKMVLAMAKDIRVVLIKLADRLHNMRTLQFQQPDRQIAIARETLDIYAPLAHRLGISAVKWQLEDLSLQYLDPEAYRNIVEEIGMTQEERGESIQKIKDVLSEKLAEQDIHAEIDGRVKHIYSIYKKMKSQNKSFDEIYDVFAVRILVDTILDCYASLGVVHTLWTQMPNRFKDYISVPKSNMYQSLHTTVVGMGGMSFEVQIRTWDMHRTSEYGIAAHWRYKEGKQADELDQKLYWLRQIVDWQSDTHDPNEFVDALKTDLFSDEVFVFTPRGAVKSMPKGATPLDFAYAVHTEVGHKCIGAKVNGRIVPLNSELQSGDFCEIITSQSSRGPSRDWLQIVKTSEARTKIRSWFKREFKDKNIASGREMLEQEAKRLGYSWHTLSKPEYLEPIYRRHTLSSLDDLYMTVGFGGLSTAQVLNRIIEQYRRTQKPDAPEIPMPKPETPHRQSTSSRGVVVEGEQGMLVRFAKCCTPVPGDDIIGYVTRGRGVSVHRSDCVNIESIRKEPERLINVRWENGESGAYSAEIQIVAYDRVGLLADISALLVKLSVSITALTARIDKDKNTIINITMEIKNAKQLEEVIKALLKRSDVIEVFRTGK